MIKLFDFSNGEYERERGQVQAALDAQNLRMRWLDKAPKGKWPADEPEPPLTSSADRKTISDYHKWRDELQNRSDVEWFRAIDSAVEERHFRAHAYCIIWWEMCEQVDLDDDAWKERFEGFDYDMALDTDWELMEYALHACGIHPTTAARLAQANTDRSRQLDFHRNEFQCTVCDRITSGYNYAPGKCKACGQYTSPIIQVS